MASPWLPQLPLPSLGIGRYCACHHSYLCRDTFHISLAEHLGIQQRGLVSSSSCLAPELKDPGIKGPWKGWSLSPQSAVPPVTATWLGLEWKDLSMVIWCLTLSPLTTRHKERQHPCDLILKLTQAPDCSSRSEVTGYLQSFREKLTQ